MVDPNQVLRYIIKHQVQPGERLPTINDLSVELGMSVSKVREELAAARTLGHIQIKPRLGMQVQPFDFGPAATLSILYALGLDRTHFHEFAELRRSVETTFWHEAVSQLTAEDFADLQTYVTQARLKLTRIPIEVPFTEHRDLHLTFFKHLQNPFVQGILEAYWAAYKAFGLALYADLSYHRDVWNYHERMVECVASGNYDAGLQALCEHMDLLRYMPEQHATDSTASTSSSATSSQSPRTSDNNRDSEVAERSSSIRHFFE